MEASISKGKQTIMKANPFFELYVGDRISSDEFVTIFSPMLVTHTEALFLPGNIVVTGIQGCGKSMLLSLLKPQVRIDYEQADRPFPVPLSLRKFICGSVNIAHSSVIDFGYRDAIDEDVLKTELLFGDFLNYLICDSILESIQIYLGASASIQTEIGLNFDSQRFDKLAKDIASLPVWEGWIGPVTSIEELRNRLKKRAGLYRRFVHGKDRQLSPELFDTSTPIGAPQAAMAELLHTSQAIDEKTEIFVDIDQYEELGKISSRNTDGKNVDYRAVINKALASRNPAVSYRIGTRGYSWRDHRRIHGTSGVLEEMRDYKYIDLDQLLKKDEDESTKIHNVFDDFAKDVFYRRLRFAEFEVSSDDKHDALAMVYGQRLTPEIKINREMGLRDPSKYLKLDAEWSEGTKEALVELAGKDLFSAKMGEIWVRQKGDVEDLANKANDKLPWQRNSNRIWKKERAQILAVLIASQARQKPMWGGAKEILDLSGGSILAFLGINQFIWSAWLQRNNRPEMTRSKLPEISVTVQSTAILRASNAWIEKIYEQSGMSAERARFVKKAADVLRKKLMDDDKLSYPGHNGFSILDEDLDKFTDVRSFLEELADYGNVLMLRHTSKNKNDGLRKKVYFHPIFCPSLGLPYIRTKEPYYSSLKEVAGWIYEAGFEVSLGAPTPKAQNELF